MPTFEEGAYQATAPIPPRTDALGNQFYDALSSQYGVYPTQTTAPATPATTTPAASGGQSSVFSTLSGGTPKPASAPAAPRTTAPATGGQSSVFATLSGNTTSSPQQPVRTPATGPQAVASTWTPDDNALVEKRMTGLLGQNSDYMKAARTSGEQYANSRGLLHSSMAAEASQLAAIKSALPIASQDAQTFTQAGLNNANTNTDTSRFNVGEANTTSRLNTELASRESVADKQLASSQAMASAQIGSAQAIAVAQIQSSQLMALASKEAAMLTASGSLMGSSLESHNTFARSVELSDLSPEAKAIAISNDETATRNAINLAGSVFGIPGLNEILGTFGE